MLLNPWSVAWIKGHAVHSFDRRNSVDLATAKYLFDLDRIGDRFHYDPVSMLAFRSDLVEHWDWKEHPNGAFTLRTNNRGFREDQPTSSEKHGTRILVAGDSHTAGLLNNAESFCSLLESRLRTTTGEAGLEVLNAAVAYTGPYCYLGTLQKNLELEPDVFVVVVFAGNDFWDDLKISYVLDGWTPPSGDGAYRARIEAAAEIWPGPVSQGFNQLYRWKHFPWEPARAVECSAHSIFAMRDLCAAHGIAFLVVVLPTKMDAEPEDDAGTQAQVAAALDLDPIDLRANCDIARQLLDRVQATDVDCLDLLPDLTSAQHPLYWRTDYHLGIAGHSLVALLLEARLEPILAHQSK